MIDEQIRDVIRIGLRTDPDPLTPDELLARASRQDRRSRDRRRGLTVLVAAALMLAVPLGLAGLLGRHREPPLTVTFVETASPKVGRYFLPVDLPEGWTLLSVIERAGDPNAYSPAEAVYSDRDRARVQLRRVDEGSRWTSSPETLAVPGGVARWGGGDFDGDGRDEFSFQVELDDTLIDGATSGIDEEELDDLLRSIAIGRDGVPEINHADYTRVAAARSGQQRVLAEWTAYFGAPGANLGAGHVWIHVERFEEPVDVDLAAGVSPAAVSVGGPSVVPGRFGIFPFWMADEHTKVTLLTNGPTTPAAVDMLGSLQEVDDAAFQEAVDAIGDAASDFEVTESVSFTTSDATAELLGDPDRPAGICLHVGGEERCDLAVSLTGLYRNGADVVRWATLDVLTDGHWYTVGYQPNDEPPIPDAEMIERADRTWYVIRHPDGALVQSSNIYGSPTRPSR